MPARGVASGALTGSRVATTVGGGALTAPIAQGRIEASTRWLVETRSASSGTGYPLAFFMLRDMGVSRRLSAASGVLLASSALATGTLTHASAQAAPTFTFAADASQPALPAGEQLANVADVSGDGTPDLIVRDYGAIVGVMLGDGAGGFSPPSSLPVGGRPVAVQVADFNGDGHPDLLVELETAAAPRQPNQAAEAVEVLSGDGTGGFSVGPKLALHEAGYAVVGDFNGDGTEDVAEVPGCGGMLAGQSPLDGEKIYLLPGSGHGTLSRGPVSISPTHGCGWQVGDFNNDGRQDLVTFSPGFVGEVGQIVVRPGTPSGEFAAPIDTTTPSQLWFLSAQPTDLDANHRLDLVAAGFTEPSTLFVVSGDGSGRFSFAGPYASGGPHLSALPATGEFAAAGRPEIVTISSSISVMEADGKGGLAAVAVLPYSGPANEVHVADVNRDGRPDLILSDQRAVSILLNEPAIPAIASPILSHRRWREGPKLASLSRKATPVGTTLSFSLNVPASVQLAFTQHVRRHGVHRRGRNVPRGALVLAAHAGFDRITFDGRLSHARKLPPGSYTLTLTATNASGSSKPVALRFTIVAARHRR
jgi:hypothetical protein